MVEIKQISEREIWVGECKVYLGDDGIIYDIAEGNRNDKELALGIKEAVLKLSNLYEKKMNLFVDLNFAPQPSSEARKVYQSIAEHDKIGKIAMFGLHPVARVLAAFIMGVSKKKDTRFFKTKEEALAWLKE